MARRRESIVTQEGPMKTIRLVWVVLFVLGFAVAPAAQAAPAEGFVDVPGGRVWYRVTGTGHGIPLLLLHGGPGGRSERLVTLAPLGDERPVVFYDQLGCGHSKAPDDPKLWTVKRYVAELAAVRKALGLKQVHLFGHSWGATLALEYLLTQRPAGVRSVIFAGPLVSTPRWVADAQRLKAMLPATVRAVLDKHEAAGTTDSAEYEKAGEEFNRRFFQRRPDPPAVTAACTGTQLNRALYQYMWGPSEFCATGTLKDYDRTARLGELRLPTLFIVGRFDEAMPETVADFQRRVPGSKLVVVEGAGHMAMIDAPREYVARLREFLHAVEK
jgi:proline iminopeptidase